MTSEGVLLVGRGARKLAASSPFHRHLWASSIAGVSSTRVWSAPSEEQALSYPPAFGGHTIAFIQGLLA